MLQIINDKYETFDLEWFFLGGTIGAIGAVLFTLAKDSPMIEVSTNEVSLKLKKYNKN